LLNESRGSEQSHSMNSSIACRYPRWASVELRLFRTANLAWSRSSSRNTVFGVRPRFADFFFAIRGGPPGPHTDGGLGSKVRVARQPVRIRGFVQGAIPLRFVVIASRRLSTGSVLILGACNKTQPARVVGETNWLIQFKFARAVSDIPAEPDEAIGGRKFLP
jgi:hypothetical protein